MQPATRPTWQGATNLLLIGERSATSSPAHWATCRPPCFQSPPHRGAVCNGRLGAAFRGSGGCLQSPPHRGAVCNLSQPAAMVAEFAFQSPPHRGAVCNLHARNRQSARKALSVPSSSGSGLQRRERQRHAKRAVPFSPLLIGERSATELELVGSEPVLSTFSPLLIGERSATSG